MKVRNRAIGSVCELVAHGAGKYITEFAVESEDGSEIATYSTIDELQEYWETYEPTEKKTRRYRLIKDLPTFKAGEIFKIFDGNLYKINESDGDDTEYETMAYHASTLKRFPNILEEWFEPIEPKEPLIKDEKIRKAVRAWAEKNSIEKVLYAERPNRSLCGLADMSENDYSIDFVGWIPTLEDDEEYTIAELCGEEEAPEPLEPTFVDIDERIKEKEE